MMKISLSSLHRQNIRDIKGTLVDGMKGKGAVALDVFVCDIRHISVCTHPAIPFMGCLASVDRCFFAVAGDSGVLLEGGGEFIIVNY
jgi:hypothetical protein